MYLCTKIKSDLKSMTKEEIESLIKKKETELQQLIALQGMFSSDEFTKRIDIRLDDINKLKKLLNK